MKIGDQFKTGDVCTASCNCVFVSYVGGSVEPQPRPDERVVTVKQGSSFPQIASCGKAAIWRVQRVD
jgi:hypothetical protein